MDKVKDTNVSRPADKGIFGSFHLGEGEFAISVSYVQEVVNAPSTYTSVPLSPSYLCGLFNLRGTVVPVIDLRELLGLNRNSAIDLQKVAIVEMQGACVGLLFDKTGEVFRNSEDERSDFEKSEGASVVSGVFKKDAGSRIVQILDVPRLFKLQNVPKDSGQGRLGRENLGKKRGGRRQCISFLVGPAKCALPISDIQEIIRTEKIGQSALGGGDCIGIIDLRGVTVPVIDFPALLKYREVDRSDPANLGDRRIIVMRLENELFGLVVDAIDSIISFFPDELIAFPLVEQKKGDMFLGCIARGGESDILLLNRDKILSNHEVAEITRGHSRIYQVEERGKEKLNSTGSLRSTYITFNVEGSYAVSIGEVKEIIELPETLLHPPGLKDHVLGVLNLRGELVTIVDGRSLYHAGTAIDDSVPRKILIFKKDQFHFGLVVDSVESIITISEKETMKLPNILLGKDDRPGNADITGAAEVVNVGGEKRSFLILSAEALARRVLLAVAA